MSDAGVAARIPKWPFYFADLVLSGFAGFVLYRLGSFEGPYEAGMIFGALLCAAIGAWISVKPWLTEHRSRVGLDESSNLKSSLQQIQQVEQVAQHIQQANSQWQGVQESASRTVSACQEIADRMKLETEDFMKFIENARDQEKNHLKLELEKYRRQEGDWLKVVVQLLDHAFALKQAAVRSGQPNVIAQLDQFQNACREVARRIGLVPFIPALGEKFDSRGHQVPDAKFNPPEDSHIGEVLATGYTYQGQLLRRALVLLAQPQSSEPATTPDPSVEPVPDEPLSDSGPLQEQSIETPAAEPEPGLKINPEQTRPEEMVEEDLDERILEQIKPPSPAQPGANPASPGKDYPEQLPLV